jgi:hypothetical protein
MMWTSPLLSHRKEGSSVVRAEPHSFQWNLPLNRLPRLAHSSQDYTGDQPRKDVRGEKDESPIAPFDKENRAESDTRQRHQSQNHQPDGSDCTGIAIENARKQSGEGLKVRSARVFLDQTEVADVFAGRSEHQAQSKDYYNSRRYQYRP